MKKIFLWFFVIFMVLMFTACDQTFILCKKGKVGNGSYILQYLYENDYYNYAQGEYAAGRVPMEFGEWVKAQGSFSTPAEEVVATRTITRIIKLEMVERSSQSLIPAELVTVQIGNAIVKDGDSVAITETGLKIVAQGYTPNPLEESNFSIPDETGDYVLRREFDLASASSNRIPISWTIKDEDTDADITAISMVMFDNTVTQQGESKIPGPYSVTINCSGYNAKSVTWNVTQFNSSFVEKLKKTSDGIVTPPPTFKTLVSLNWNIYSDTLTRIDLTNQAMVSLNNSPITQNYQVEAGTYSINITCPNYQSKQLTINVPAAPTYHFDASLSIEYVIARYEITCKKCNAIQPSVQLDGKTFTQGMKVTPGSHQLSITATQHIFQTKNITIPAVPEYLVKEVVIHQDAAHIFFVTDIISDFQDEKVTPNTIKLNGQEQEVSKILDGEVEVTAGSEYKIEVEAPGYEAYEGEFTVPGNATGSYRHDVKLISLPRPVAWEVGYDVYPSQEQSEELGECSVSIESAAGRQDIELHQAIKPNRYKMLFQRKGYEPFTYTLWLTPGETEHIVKNITLQAKLRTLNANIQYDVQPPTNLDTAAINFIDVDSKAMNQVPVDGQIRPGKYSYEVFRPGYKMQGTRPEIVIEPDEVEYQIEATMVAQPRKIVIDAKANNVLVNPTSVLINDKPYRYETLYQPGEYRIVVSFDKYKTWESTITVMPGNGNFMVQVPLQNK